MRKIELYVAKRPDGSLVPMRPELSAFSALAAVPLIEVEVGRDRVSLERGRSAEARCWRANKNSYEWSLNLAAEIADLLAYEAVRVEVVEVPS